jgi:hypothetical protein
VARLVGGRRVKLRGESPWSASSLALSRDSERPSKGKLTPALDETRQPGPSALRLLLSHGEGGVSGAPGETLAAIRSGRLRIDWYFMRKESEGRPGPVLVGTGRADTRRGGSLRLALKLTAIGKQLLHAHGSSLQLTANGTFTTNRGKTVTATRLFTLSR